jgi:hypothetical protein
VLVSPIDDGKTWSQIPLGDNGGQGGVLDYDSGHDLLYAAQGSSGLYRMRTK